MILYEHFFFRHIPFVTTYLSDLGPAERIDDLDLKSKEVSETAETATLVLIVLNFLKGRRGGAECSHSILFGGSKRKKSHLFVYKRKCPHLPIKMHQGNMSKAFDIYKHSN